MRKLISNISYLDIENVMGFFFVALSYSGISGFLEQKSKFDAFYIQNKVLY